MLSHAATPRFSSSAHRDIESRLKEALRSGQILFEILPSDGKSLAQIRGEVLAYETTTQRELPARIEAAKRFLHSLPAAFATFRQSLGQRACDIELTAEMERGILDWAGKHIQRGTRALDRYLRAGKEPLEEPLCKALSQTFVESYLYLREILIRFHRVSRNQVFLSTNEDPLAKDILEIFSMPATTRLALEAFQAITRIGDKGGWDFLVELDPSEDVLFDAECRASHNLALCEIAAQGYRTEEIRSLLVERAKRETDRSGLVVTLEHLCDQMGSQTVAEYLLKVVADDWLASRHILDRVIRDAPLEKVPDKIKRAILFYSTGSEDDLLRLSADPIDPTLLRNRYSYLQRIIKRREAGQPVFEAKVGEFTCKCLCKQSELGAQFRLFGYVQTTNLVGWSPWLDTRLLLFRGGDPEPVGYLQFQETEEVRGDKYRSVVAILPRRDLPLEQRAPLLPALLLGAIELAKYRGDTRPIKVAMTAYNYCDFGGEEKLVDIR